MRDSDFLIVNELPVPLILGQDFCKMFWEPPGSEVMGEDPELPSIGTGSLEEEVQKIWQRMDERARSPLQAAKGEPVHLIVEEGAKIPTIRQPWTIQKNLKEATKRQIDKLLSEGILIESSAPHDQGMVVQTKSNGKVCVCFDGREISKVLQEDPYPVPLINDVLDEIGGNQIFSVLDLSQGYHQIPLDEESQDLLTMITP